MRFHVGAYAMSPCGARWDARLEADFIAGLRSLPFVAGIELPHYTTLDRWDEGFFFDHADPAWDYVVNTLPSVSAALREKATFGLAAVDDDSRHAAIAGIRLANASVHRANDRLGRRAVRAVEIHSAPSAGRLNGTGSKGHFQQSLEEIGRWDWDDAELVVEHCDAAFDGQPFQKGFLTVDEEIAAIKAANRHLDRPITASLNWARSAIEGRSPATVARHVALLIEAGLMRGMIFSGCGAVETPYGAWQDTHMPQGREPYVAAFEDHALLTEHEIRLALAQMRSADIAFLGLKIAARPIDTPVKRRLDLLASALQVLASAYLATH